MALNAHWMLMFVVAAALVGCGSSDNQAPPQREPSQPPQPPQPLPPSPDAVASVTINNLHMVDTLLGPGESRQYRATVKNAAGETLTNRTVTWTSSAPDVLSISETGSALARSPGSASVIATSEGITAAISIKVSSLGYLSIGAETYSLQPGTSVQLTTRALNVPYEPKVVDVQWVSSEPTIASVSASGLLTAHVIGSTTVTAIFGEFTESARFGVQHPVLGKIAFHSNRPSPGVPSYHSGGLYLMDANGSNPALMIADEVGPCSSAGYLGGCPWPWEEPSWSSDGMRIATTSLRFHEERFAQVLFLCTTSNAFCEEMKPFPPTFSLSRFRVPFQGDSPTWSPDGRLLAFDYSRDLELWNAADSSMTRVRPSELAGIGRASWSPDGSRLVVSAQASENDEPDIWTMNLDGTGIVRLTNSAGNEWWPAWSPAGNRIAFVSTRTGDREIFVMNVDGTDELNLTQNVAEDSSPTWSPDGRSIAFHSNRDGNFEIYVVDVDGTDLRNLTNDPSHDKNPAWGPAPAH